MASKYFTIKCDINSFGLRITNARPCGNHVTIISWDDDDDGCDVEEEEEGRMVLLIGSDSISNML